MNHRDVVVDDDLWLLCRLSATLPTSGLTVVVWAEEWAAEEPVWEVDAVPVEDAARAVADVVVVRTAVDTVVAAATNPTEVRVE